MEKSYNCKYETWRELLALAITLLDEASSGAGALFWPIWSIFYKLDYGDLDMNIEPQSLETSYELFSRLNSHVLYDGAYAMMMWSRSNGLV